MKLSQVAIAFTLLVTGAAQGESSLPPPTWPVPDIKPSGMQTQPVTGITLGSFHVTFEKATFNDILGALGKAPIGQQGDAGEFLMWACYTVPAAHARIWLTSSELGGKKYIDGMVAKQLTRTEKENPQCPTLANKATVASIDNGVWLGETVQKIKEILGSPNRAPHR
jgi:hypothetical protein